MSTYSSRLFAGVMSAVADTNLYVVAAGTTVVLRDIEIYNYSGAVQALSLSVLVSGANFKCLQLPLPVGIQTTQWQGRIVLEPTDILQGHCTTVDNFLYVSGYVLTG